MTLSDRVLLEVGAGSWSDLCQLIITATITRLVWSLAITLAIATLTGMPVTALVWLSVLTLYQSALIVAGRVGPTS